MAEAAPARVELREQAALGLGEQRLGERLARRLGLGRAPQRADERLRLRGDVLRPLPVRVGDRAQHLPERGQPVPRLGREVRAAEERLAVGREEDGERPAALAGERDDRVHVHGVDVRPLLAIDLDVDEELVHDAPPSPRRRTTRAPSRGTSGRRSSRSRRAAASPPRGRAPSASSPHGCQSTGLSACWRR